MADPAPNPVKPDTECSLRPAEDGDTDFLVAVFASTRAAEFEPLGWGPAQLTAFLKMQFDMRRRGYRAAFPSAVESVVIDRGQAAGSVIVFRGPAEIRLVDIALLPGFRNRGLGARLISQLIEEAGHAAIPLRLSVTAGNPAIHLYQRLGFVTTGQNQVYLEMECLHPNA